MTETITSPSGRQFKADNSGLWTYHYDGRNGVTAALGRPVDGWWSGYTFRHGRVLGSEKGHHSPFDVVLALDPTLDEMED